MWTRRWNDVWPVLLVAVPGLIGTRGAGDDETGWTRAPDLAAHLLVVAAALAAAAVHRRPAVTLAGCGAAVAAYLAAGYPVGPILVAVPVAAAGAAVSWPPRRTLLGTGALAVLVCGAGALRYGAAGPPAGWVLTVAGLVAVPVVVGAATRSRRAAEAELRTAHALRAVTEERLRMAQELHDSVGHGLAVIAMQAGVALTVLDRSPAKARASLEAIQATSREALHGMRVQVGLLRDGPGGPAPLGPAPGLADAGVLLERVRGGGLTVAADLRPGPVPAEVGAAAYRILQESLTNVLRHAGATTARVRAERDGDDLVLEVCDDGPGEAGPPAAPAGRRGTGIAGMRARAEALGGALTAGPRPAGGFVVRATLPLAGRDAT